MASTWSERAPLLKQPERKEMGTSGEGTKFQCKLVGITDVISPEGVDMCAEAFGKLKAKKKWRRKERVTLTISLEGIRIEDETTQKVKHTHPVKRILFVTPDPDDKKIFGYVCSQPDCSTGYKLYALKSENAKTIIDAITVLLVESVNLRRRTGSAKKQVLSNSSNENQTEQEQLREEVDQLQEKEGMNSEVGELEEQLTRRDQETNELERSLSTAQQILRDNQAQRSLEMDCQEAQKQQLGEKAEGDETLREHFEEMERGSREEITVVLCEQITEKDQKLTEMIQQLTVTEKREEDLKTQIKNVEEQLRENENLRTNLRDVEQRLTQKEAQEENLRLSLEQMEQRMREELTQKETRETELRKKLREREEQVVDYQRHLSGMEQQLSEKNDQKETLLKQLREMEQRSREVTAENEMRENEFREQIREREQELREMAHQLIEKEQQQKDLRTQTEQRMREEMIEETTRLGKQLRERDQQIENFQMQLQGLREQLREKDQHLANARTQVKEQELLRTENANLRQQVVNFENHTGSQPDDWVISRDNIQLTDKSLGVGGWGKVFEGRYCGCSVAVKRIHEAINSPHNQSLFQREIDIASRCRHPCLLQFIGATNDEEIPLFVTELMESNLRELLEQRPLSREEITVISLDVARALNYLHQKKPPIFHRDVSSGNVLLWRQANQWRGKVSDYGSAKFEEQFMSIGPGCFAYSAPEVQILAEQTAKIDVYSFGVLLCEMCIQTFPDYENRERQIAQMTDHVLQDLVHRCLRSDPTERPDMTDIISTLEEFSKTL